MTWINLLETIYPVGSVYISTLQISPSSTIGGTWRQITDAVLRGSNSTGYTGSDTHTLTVDEMPTHRHTQNTPYYALNSGSGTGHTTYWGPYGTDTELPVTTFTGGGHRTPLCNALTISLSGTEQHKFCKRGGR